MATANATVMFTDIRGFTARTSREPREGLEELLQTHEALLLPVIKHYDGRVVKTIGDAFLVVFESPTNAVLCGVVIQRRLLEFNRTAPEAKRIEVRVAINSGEVTLRGDDVFGEPVNICARIEGITEPNEIYFTEATYLTMQKAEVPSSVVGSRRLKGIPEEIKLYRVLQDEDNELYRAIVAEPGIVDDGAASVAGSLSVPQWPPPRGRLRGPRASPVPLLLAVLAVAVLVVGYLAVQSYREAHRYDAARAALEAGDWSRAQRLAGELWGGRGDDQEAIKLLTEAITGELDQLVAAGDVEALQDAWTARRLAWGNLPARADLERRVSRAKLALQVDAGDAAGALAGLLQLHEADKADRAVSDVLVRALRQILVIDFEGVRDQRTLDTWLARFQDLSVRHGDLPGFEAVRADASYGMGMALTAAENNFWKDAGIQLLRTFLQEQPDDRQRGFRARVRLVALRRWHGDPAQLRPYLAADPALAKEPGVREAVLDYLSHSYDLDDEEDVAARELAWSCWGEDLLPALGGWLDSGNEKERLNAYLMLRDADRLTDDEADRVLAWVLLQLGSGHEAEMLLALDHWTGLLRADPGSAAARAAAAVPKPLTEVGALGRGGTPLGARETSDAEWRDVVSRCFYDQVKYALLPAVVTSRYASERAAARAILTTRGALTDTLASESHLLGLQQWNRDAPDYTPPDLLEAVDYFLAAAPAGLHDRAAVRAALQESQAIVADKVAAIEQAANLSGSDKRRRTKAWGELASRIQAALDHLGS